MGWNENKPEAHDPLSELPSVLTANAVTFRQSIEKHSYWTDSSGLSAGLTRLSDGSFGPGSFRAFFGPESSLSTAVSAVKPLAGRLYLTSDTQRLYGLASNATIPLGGKNMIAYLGGSGATIQSNVRTLVQLGSLFTAVGNSTITFGTAYTTTPVVQVQPMSAATTALVLAQVNVTAADHFSVSMTTIFGTTSSFTFMWKSFGTVTL